MGNFLTQFSISPPEIAHGKYAVGLSRGLGCVSLLMQNFQNGVWLF